MSLLQTWLASVVQTRIHEGSASERPSETRLIFHGPTLQVLDGVFSLLTGQGKSLGIPVLLQVAQLEVGETNPRSGASGRCDEGHLLDLRNSPQGASFLALVPPGQHAIRSVTSTTDEFGMLSASNGANVAFEEWWSDPFLQDAITHALSSGGFDGKQLDEAQTIVARACRAFDDVDPASGSRAAAWRLIARVFEVAAEPKNAAGRLSLACGVPPSNTGRLVAGQQHASLDGIAAALSEGFATGLASARDQVGEAERGWIDDFLPHIRSTCQVLTALDRSPEAFYAPWSGLDLPAPPAWWEGLTAEVWAELLEDEPEIFGDIRIECSNPLLPPSRGVPLLVESEVKISVSAIGSNGEPVDVLLERSPGRSGNNFPQKLLVDGKEDLLDEAPPGHRSPIQYKASAENFRTAAMKVISLATLIPGIFVACRTARKVTPPKAPSRRTKGANWETSLTLPGPGRYELLAFLSPGSSIEAAATGVSGSDNGDEERQSLPAREVHPGLHQLEVEVDGSYQVDLPFRRTLPDGKIANETCRIFLSCDDVVEEGCNSEFERLILVNRRQVDPSGAKPVVQLNRSARTSTLQGWLLQDENVARSFLPIVLAEDYGDHWVQPNWSEETGRILSAGRYHKDPRPPASQFNPPPAFVSARTALAKLIRGEDDQSGLIEAAPLGEWLRQDTAFQSLVEEYLDAYTLWLESSPEIAPWSDVVVVASLEPGQRTLARSPDAILLSPLHPLRMAWHALAQRVLDDAALSAEPCPAAGIFDPGVVPDILHLPLVSPEGVEMVPFLAIETNTDYWSVLWNGRRLRELAERSRAAPFDATFGITIGGISAGFSAAQVSRALNDVCNVLCAKPVLSVAVSSAGGATDACNDGLVQWSSERYAESDKPARIGTTGSRRLDVFDMRDNLSRPDDATIANLSEDTLNHVRWFGHPPEGKSLDLGIIAQLDSSEPDTAETPTLSALGAGALIRHRVRRQLPSEFLSESRQSRHAEPVGDTLADKVAACVTQLESSPVKAVGLRFAPNVHAIGDMLERRQADFVAVSSSAIDPACFLGGWLPQSYLWDYDLPSYSQRAGDTNGYYLLSRVKDSDCDALRRALSRLPGCDDLPDEKVGPILLEVARRGIPTIRGLSGDDTGATGDLGLFVAARLLQDRFRNGGSADSLVPVMDGSSHEPTIALVIPIDPFRGYLDDLARVLNRDRSEGGFSRPDLLVVNAVFGLDGVRLHLTPVEVKCRLGTILSTNDSKDALNQAKSLSSLLSKLASHQNELSIWRLSYQHLLLSIIGFGMRVYSQHEDLAGSGADWSALHERIASSILADANCVTIDERGRLIVIDDSAFSDAVDRDGDGFEETIVIGATDAGRIVGGDAQALHDSIKAKVNDWQLLPAARPATPIITSLPPSDGLESAGVEIVGELGNTNDDDGPGGLADDAKSGQVPVSVEIGADVAATDGIRLRIGTTVDGFDKRELSLALSDTKLNQLNMGVVGDLGTGKTQLLKSLVLQIASSTARNRDIRPRLLIFDYKKDYSSPEFVAATGAKVIKPQKLPLNLFDVSDIGDAMTPWLDRFRFFADVLDKIYSGIGPVQRDKLKRAVRIAYENKSGVAPTIYDVHAAYAELLEGKSDSPMAIIDDLVDMDVFESDPAKCIKFDEFLQGVVVVSLDAFGQDDRSKNMLVAIMLNMFYENMLKTPKRPFLGVDPQLRVIDSYLLVDEADNIMRYEFDVLRKLLLQGREFGCGVILASQYLRHFKVNATDYREPLLTWFVHKVPNVTASELSALGLANSPVELAERVKSLANHQCLYKSFDSPGQVVRGLPFYELAAQIPAGSG